MADTIYIDYQPPAVGAAWLNDINNFYYRGTAYGTTTYSFVSALNYTDSGVLGSFASSTNSFNQVILQNKNNGANASTNLNVSNDAATANTNFGEFGINSSGFTGVGSFNQPGNVYLAAATGDLVLGTYSAKSIRFVVNNGNTDAGSVGPTGIWNIPFSQSTVYPAGSVGKNLQTTLNVKSAPFNAVLDGTVDDTAAINAAIAAAGVIVQNNLAQEGTIVTAAVYLPPGIAAITGLNALPDGVTLYGAGSSISGFKFIGTPGTILPMGDSTTVNGSTHKANINIRDLFIYAVTPNAATIGINVTECIRNCSIERVQIWNCGIGINLTNTPNWTLRIIDCFVHDSVVNSLYLRACNTAQIIRGRYDTAGGDNIIIDGIYASGDILDFKMDGVTVQGAQFNGIKTIDCSQLNIQNCDIEGNGLAGAGYSDILVVRGSRSITMSILTYENNFNSYGGAAGNHHILDLSFVTCVVFRNNKSANNYDVGLNFTSNVGMALISGCNFDGVVTPYTLGGTTQVFYQDNAGKITVGDSRANAATLDVQQARANTNLANFYNTSTTAGSVGVQVKVPAHAGNTLPIYVTNDLTNIMRLVDDGRLAALKLCPGTDAGAIQTGNGIYMGSGAPSNANGSNGDFYFNTSGGVGTRLYFKTGGAWANIL